METKLIEIRDRATCIPVMATRVMHTSHAMWRANGYRNGHVLITRIADRQTALWPSEWPHAPHVRTMPEAHNELYQNWDIYNSGDVLDVEFVLGETDAPKASQYR